MGRKSKLTEKQWAQVLQRVLDGEKVASLAREFGIAPSTMREKISGETETVKSLAKQIVETEQRKNNLPLSVVVQAISLADKMMAIQNDLSDAAVAGARTAKLVSEANLNHVTTNGINSDDDLKSSVVAAMAVNNHGKLGMDLLTLAAKPGAVKQDNSGPGSKLVTLTPEEIKQINEEIENAC